jgi:hypothetical protein
MSHKARNVIISLRLDRSASVIREHLVDTVDTPAGRYGWPSGLMAGMLKTVQNPHLPEEVRMMSAAILLHGWFAPASPSTRTPPLRPPVRPSVNGPGRS